MRSTQEIARGEVADEITNQAWEVSGSWVVTGEPASDRGVRPRANFDPAANQWGALQLLARYTRLWVDDEVFARGFAAAGASSSARSFTLAANWYPTPFVKYYATYERTVFGEGSEAARPAENVILFRIQLAF
jgi:phosphate-selective porin OprO/OprP